jgi:TPP-dependent pyruvate/acetoin dehydrogenase alpha subunit
MEAEHPRIRTSASFPRRGLLKFIRAFRCMLLSRTLDEKLACLYRLGNLPGGGVYLSKGQEAVSVSAGLTLRKGDVFAPTIRDSAGRLAFGETIEEALRTCLGSILGPMRGREGNVHRGRPKDGYLPMISHLGAMISVVNGMLMARRFKGIENTVGTACLGDGATSTGSFHEGLNQAAVEHLPLVTIVANNQYAYSTPNSRQFACASLFDRAVGYGITGHRVDGTNLFDCLRVVGLATDNARRGKGPQMVVAELLRLCGHGEHDPADYVDPLLKASPFGVDCMERAEKDLLERGWTSPGQIAIWKSEAADRVEKAVALVQSEPSPDPLTENWSAFASSRS